MLEFNFLYFHIALLHFLKHNNLGGFSLQHAAHECYNSLYSKISSRIIYISICSFEKFRLTISLGIFLLKHVRVP